MNIFTKDQDFPHFEFEGLDFKEPQLKKDKMSLDFTEVSGDNAYHLDKAFQKPVDPYENCFNLDFSPEIVLSQKLF